MFIFLKRIFSFFFPPSCIICSEKTNNLNLCDYCRGQLPLTREFPRPWIFSLYQYKHDYVNQCIKHIKQYPDHLLMEALIQDKQSMITGWLTGLAQYHHVKEIILVPVPIHYSRFIDRGFNQTLLIAESIQKVITLKYGTITIIDSLIQKQHATEKQALFIHKKSRLENELESSFRLTHTTIPTDGVIVIIDDVTTTGATLDAMRNHLITLTPHVYAFTLSH